VKLVYTPQALESLKEALEFIAPNVSTQTLHSIRDRILLRADKLLKRPLAGRREEYLMHLGMNHRRVIESHYKIIYRIKDNCIYVTDIFDTRQDPAKMKG
jgi:toxin ParE1/3/4